MTGPTSVSGVHRLGAARQGRRAAAHLGVAARRLSTLIGGQIWSDAAALHRTIARSLSVTVTSLASRRSTTRSSSPTSSSAAVSRKALHSPPLLPAARHISCAQRHTRRAYDDSHLTFPCCGRRL